MAIRSAVSSASGLAENLKNYSINSFATEILASS